VAGPLSPAPDSSDSSSVADKFYDAASASSTQDDAAALGEDSARPEGQVAQDHGAHHLETDPDDYQPEQRGASSPFRGFPTPPCRVTFDPQLQFFEEESKPEDEESEPEPEDEESEPEPEDEEAEPPGEPQAAGAVGRGTRGNLAQAHQVDPACSSIDPQALYYDVLLTKIDRHMEEAGRTLQALQGALPHEQLRQRTAIGQRSRILRDELAWAEHHL
jgi:hypothetical protein